MNKQEGPIKILWCDDDDEFLQSALEYFENSKITIDGREIVMQSVSSAGDATELEDLEDFDILIVDVLTSPWYGLDIDKMMDGILAGLRKRFDGGIIFCSAIGGLEYSVELLQEKHDDALLDCIQLMGGPFPVLPEKISKLLTAKAERELQI